LPPRVADGGHELSGALEVRPLSGRGGNSRTVT